MIRNGAVIPPEISTDGGTALIEALGRDASSLRALVSEHRQSSGSPPLS
jgi:hypothetical protein